MGLGTSDLGAADLHFSVTVERPLLQVSYVINGRRCGNGLKNGAGHESGAEQAVDVNALILRVIICDLRRVLRVISRGGHHADDLPRFVIVNTHCALPAIQRVIGGGAYIGIQRQSQIAPAAGAGTGDGVIPGKLAGKTALSPGTDAAGAVAHRVEGAFADAVALVVHPLAILGLHQHLAVPVQNTARCHHTVGIEMPVGRKRGPLAAVDEEFDAEDHQAQHEHSRQQQAKDSPFLNLLHRFPLLIPACSAAGWQSWHSAAYPPLSKRPAAPRR